MIYLRSFLLIELLSVSSVFAQNASAYFPLQADYKWYFKSVPLDTLNNPVDSLTFYGIDSFAVTTPYFGKDAKVVLSKTGSLSTINSLPFLDSAYFNFEGTNGWEYFDPTIISELIGNPDTSLGINFITFFNSLEGWYSYYRFASPSNTDYQIFKKDTAVTINSVTATLRFELRGKRLPDEQLNTELGVLDCKKFSFEVRISYLLLGSIPIKMFGVENTIWIAPDNWKVKSYIPATNIDLSYLGFPAFKIPGLESNIITPITSVKENDPEILSGFILYQNYPNPFNPGTTLSFVISKSSLVKLKIYDVLGNEVAVIVDEYKQAGKYEVEFQATAGSSQLSSGVYFYQISAGNFLETKKMILIR